MGKVLEQYYDFAKKKGAYALRMRLAMMTGWTTVQIHKIEDSKNNIAKVKTALKTLLKSNDIPDFEGK
jgi:ribosomal protein L29